MALLEDNFVKRIVGLLLDGGADYGEVYSEESRSRSIRFVDKKVERASSGINCGVGVRAFFGRNQVFAYTSGFKEDAVERAARSVAEAGGAAARKEQRDLILTPVKAESPHVFEVSPWDVVLAERVDFLKAVDASARGVSGQVSQVDASVSESEKTIEVFNSEGDLSVETRVYTRAGIDVIAVKDKDKESAYRSPGALAGFEHIRSLDPAELGREAAESAVTAVNAPYVPAGTMPVVVGNAFGGVIFHEACGHALETTSIAKDASVFKNKLGEQIASECVTAVDDGTMANKWGSSVLDDEGTPTRRTLLIDKGILKSYMVDRLGSVKTGYEVTGSGRRQSYHFAPTSRMRNTYIDKGDATVDEIISSVAYGLYAKRMGGGSVMPSTGRFNFSVAEGFMIRDGRVAEAVRGATLIGSGQEVLKKIVKVADDLELAAGVCGSVSGGVPTTVGQPTILVSELVVGGRT